MTNLTIIRENTKKYDVSITDELGAPISLVDSIVKFIIGDFLCKTSYYASEVEFTDAPNGLCRIHLRVSDTKGKTAKERQYEVELTRRESLASSGVLELTASSNVMEFTSGDLSLISEGDIIEITNGSASNNQLSVTVESIDETDGTITTDYCGFSTQASVEFNSYVADRKTPIYGTFTIEADARKTVVC